MRQKALLFLISVIVTTNCDILDTNIFFGIMSDRSLLQDVGKFDPPIIIRVDTIAFIAAFDALAPYHDTAIGIHTKIPRFSPNQRTLRNKNIAMCFAAYRAIAGVYPPSSVEMKKLLLGYGLDVNNQSLDMTTPIGIGNFVGKEVLKAFENDGMNQLGNAKKFYNTNPYEDYTHYKPKNTAYDFKYAGNWQPNIEPSTTLLGAYFVQQFIFPQYGFTRPYSIKDLSLYSAKAPINSHPWNRFGYKNQTKEIIKESKNLNDYRKMAAEHFDSKLEALYSPMLFLILSRNLSLDDAMFLQTAASIALFDAGIVAWKEKLKYDTVRPFSAIRYLYGNEFIEAWGGPGKGTVKNITGKEWRSYIRTAAHPDYPSGSACFCSAEYEAIRQFFGNDKFLYAVNKEKGSSVIEPGITPAKNITLGPYITFQDYIDECATSRVWGGVHFRAAVEEGKKLCKPIGEAAFNFVKKRYLGIEN